MHTCKKSLQIRYIIDQCVSKKTLAVSHCFSLKRITHSKKNCGGNFDSIKNESWGFHSFMKKPSYHSSNRCVNYNILKWKLFTWKISLLGFLNTATIYHFLNEFPNPHESTSFLIVSTKLQIKLLHWAMSMRFVKCIY